MALQRTYPPGVPCWIDTEQPDLQAASHFYGSLFGWQFEDAMPPGAPGSYLIARLDGQDIAAIAPADDAGTGEPVSWHTYIAVEDADMSAALVTSSGGSVVVPPQDAGPGGRYAACQDPGGAAFRLWQARRRLGAQLTNAPGAWNFSNLHTPDLSAVLPFYGKVFGWQVSDMGEDAGAMLRVPGYGDHLASTVDPGIYERQSAAPEGFADVIGGMEPAAPGETPHWHVVFTVADRDESAAAAERLGGSVLSTSQSPWALGALIRDPHGAEFSVSQFTPLSDWPSQAAP